MPQSGKRLYNSDIALLGAFSLFLSALDYLIPKPLPFMRLGLANLPLLLALDIFSLKSYCLLVLIKVLGQAIITGSLFSYVFLFSLAGSLSSAAVMFALYRVSGGRSLSLAGTGIAGAFVSNSVQLVLARFFVFGKSAVYLAPPFLAAGIISGAALGIFAETFVAKSIWLRQKKEAQVSGPRPKTTGEKRAGSLPRLCAGCAFAVLFLLVPRI
jgi:heptaprenyl diphosphate synthase